MTTLPCAIYKHVLHSSQYVYCFFEAKKTDDFAFLGWAKYKKSRGEWDMSQPIKTGFYRWIRIEFFPSMLDGIQTIWESIPQTASKGECQSEIDDHEMRIYKDGELKLTLTK